MPSERNEKGGLGGGAVGMMTPSVFPPKLSSSEKYGKGEEKLEIYFPVHEGIS